MILMKIKKFLARPVIIYGLCSVFTMLLEMVIGLTILEVFLTDIIIANVISMIVGAIVHYYIVSRKVFLSNINVKNSITYIWTFLLGLFLQNIVLKICYDYMFVWLYASVNYILSKGCSVVIPFAAMYIIRKKLLKREK